MLPCRGCIAQWRLVEAISTAILHSRPCQGAAARHCHGNPAIAAGTVGIPALMAYLQAGRTAPLGSLAKILGGSKASPSHLAGSGRLLALSTALLPIPGKCMPHDGDLQGCRP